MVQKVTHSAEQTRRFGRQLARHLRGGEVIALIGDLGAGKTVLVKGMAVGLGIKHRVSSPTFVLMRVYPVQPHKTIRRFVHVDAYRVRHAAELLEIGLVDYLGQPDTVTVIEWADRVREILPHKTIRVQMEHGKSFNQRKLTVKN